jgi:hypothetical protein
MNSLVQIALFKLLRFLEPPEVHFDPERLAAFDALYETAVRPGAGGWIDYRCPYPKAEFLTYLVQRQPVLLHGSGNTAIDTLEPRRQTLFNGPVVTGVFATSDGIWPLFFATMPWAQGLGWSTRNGALTVRERRFYFFSLSENMAEYSWQNGAIYILPRAPFQLQSPTWQEWTCPEPVTPLAKLAVSPEDFPFRQQVGTHKLTESSPRYFLRRMAGARGINGGTLDSPTRPASR